LNDWLFPSNDSEILMQVNCLRLPCWNQWRNGEKDRCGRRGFRRDLCVIENQKLGVAGAAFIVTLASSKT
jgi:hypothetical protein